MPNPRRLVRRSIRLVERFGYDRHHAAIMVCTIAREVKLGLAGQSVDDYDWICEVSNLAWAEVRRTLPPIDTQEVDQHGS